MYSWIILALLAAVTRVASQLARKKAVTYTSPLTVTFAMRLLSLPVVTAFALVSGGFVWPNDRVFWLLVILAGVIESVATVASIASLKAANISQVAPLQSFIPVFMLPIAFVLFGAFPPAYGVLGVFLIVAGGYVLNLKRQQTWGYPLKVLLRDRGSWLMVVYALLSAFVFVITKKLLEYTNPATILVLLYVIQLVCMAPYLAKHYQRPSRMSTFVWYLVFIAIITGASQLLASYAIDETYASYAVGVQRLDVILMVVLGWVLFGEERKKRQFYAAVLATVGTILVALNS